MSASARDAHRSATVLTCLVFLWGCVSLLIDPWELFGVASLIQTLGAGGLLIYLLLAWKRPHQRVAEVTSAILIGYVLVAFPFAIAAWCRIGRPLDTFFIPHIAAVSMALVLPGRWWVGVTAMTLFIAESLLAYFYARHVGLEALIPVTEPFATVAIAMLGTALFVLRGERRGLARQHVRVRGEIQALERARPLFVRAQEELETQLAVLAAEADGAVGASSGRGAVGRALERLEGLRGKLANLAVGDRDVASAPEAERQLLARDAQFGATLLAGLTTALAIPGMFTARALLGRVPVPLIVQFVLALLIVSYLIATRRRPSSRRALWAVVAVLASQLPAVAYHQSWLLGLERPYEPFLGYKLLMAALGLTMATRFRLGIVLIVFTAMNAMVVWFVLDLGAHRELIALGEPINTLAYVLVGIAALRILEQRQIASIQLLRAEADASAMHRRAKMFLALRDRLNSPLQTLVLGADGAGAQQSGNGSERSRAAIDRLVVLSRDLADLDVFVPRPTVLDADYELRRH